MFSLCEGHVSYNNIPLHRKRWFVLAVFFWVLWLPLLFYYLPVETIIAGFNRLNLFHVPPVNLFTVFVENHFFKILLLCIFWGILFGILFTGDIYAHRKNSVYKIKLKYIFILLHIVVLTGAIALIGGAVSAVLHFAPENIRGLFTTIVVWMIQLLEGSRITLWLTILAVSAGLVLSLFLALGKMSKKQWLNRMCSAYVFFFRGTPLLMQLYFIYYGLPQITSALTINSRFIAAFIAFSLNSAAYCAEIIRAAILSIDKGQFEAAKALRMSYGQTMAHVIIPQSIRRLIPPVGNEFIMMLKDASLVSIIALTDITKVTRSISSSTASAMVYIPAMILYLIITAVFTFIFHKLEKKYSVYV
jgi:polar amino acid transport system permease protein